MVTLDQIQSFMKTHGDEDKALKRVQASGDTLEDALQQASIELGLALRKIEYEVVEHGSKGTFGFGKKPWLLVAYESKKQKAEDARASADQTEGELEEISRDRDGQVFVRRTPDGVFLKVTPPVGNGRKIIEPDAIDKINMKIQGEFDSSLVAKIVKLADGEYVHIGDYDYRPSRDPVLSVDVTDGEMKAFLTMHPPGEGGADPDYESIVSFLQINKVVHGFKEDAIRAIVDEPEYGMSRLVAEGRQPRNGMNAQIEYSFPTNTSKVNLREKNGRVDFKELNLTPNVVEGQILARKIPPELGEAGRTVTGNMIPARDGADTHIDIGKNVHLSDDGDSAIADINGQVVVTSGKLNVEEIMTVQGDVNLKTGNILFLGTVVVKGNVDDGFSVKAAGNIEVMGTVSRCNLDAEGDIIVHQGIAGKSSGKIVSGKSVWSKFIENADVEAGDLVVVSDGIINSRIIANRKIICKGKRASIVGGHCMAAEEIDAKALGSIAGSETILEVGFDPKSKENLDKLEVKAQELEKQLEEVNLNLGTLEALRKKTKLPEDKQQYYKELSTRKGELSAAIEEVARQVKDINTYLGQLTYNGKISSSGTVFPGVRIIIKDAQPLDVRNEFKNITFIAENKLVKPTKYEESTEDITRKV
ncbi:MAG: FapA family protein [Spirochaetaceae bacterium]|nr:FapA family protein [Spirochaetaceae bacterium]